MSAVVHIRCRANPSAVVGDLCLDADFFLASLFRTRWVRAGVFDVGIGLIAWVAILGPGSVAMSAGFSFSPWTNSAPVLLIIGFGSSVLGEADVDSVGGLSWRISHGIKHTASANIISGGRLIFIARPARLRCGQSWAVGRRSAVGACVAAVGCALLAVASRSARNAVRHSASCRGQT